MDKQILYFSTNPRVYIDVFIFQRVHGLKIIILLINDMVWSTQTQMCGSDDFVLKIWSNSIQNCTIEQVNVLVINLLQELVRNEYKYQ